MQQLNPRDRLKRLLEVLLARRVDSEVVVAGARRLGMERLGLVLGLVIRGRIATIVEQGQVRLNLIDLARRITSEVKNRQSKEFADADIC